MNRKYEDKVYDAELSVSGGVRGAAESERLSKRRTAIVWTLVEWALLWGISESTRSTVHWCTVLDGAGYNRYDAVACPVRYQWCFVPAFNALSA
jgi:hypothetical protein